MDEKASNIHQKPFLAKAAEAHQRLSMRPFCVLHAVLLGGCAGALLMGSYMVGMGEMRSIDFGECLYPLGGGLVLPGGSFPQKLNAGKQCETVRRRYLEKQYDKDVEDAISTAWDFFVSYDEKPERSQVVVFDIDETTLSNRAEWLTSLQREGVQRIRHATPSQNSSSGGLLPKNLRHKEPELIPQAPQESAPALKPTLKLYKELYRRGFSVTFITGRTESGGARESTAKNLLQAGYGGPCSEAVLPSASSASPQSDGSDVISMERRDPLSLHRKLLKDPGVDATRQQAPLVKDEEEPCYLELGMREEGDRRLASVYKPEKRGKLQGRGYTILASFGDQWSDLSGTSAGKASFLLPNPFYYLL